MQIDLRHRIAVAGIIVIVGILAVFGVAASNVDVAAASAPGANGSVSFQLHPFSVRMCVPDLLAVTRLTTGPGSASLTGATHSGNGCPIALPGA